MRRDSLLKKSIAASLGASLLILSPGLDLYKAFADVIGGQAGVPVAAGAGITVTPGVPGVSGGGAPVTSSGNLLGGRGLNGRFNRRGPALPSPVNGEGNNSLT